MSWAHLVSIINEYYIPIGATCVNFMKPAHLVIETFCLAEVSRRRQSTFISRISSVLFAPSFAEYLLYVTELSQALKLEEDLQLKANEYWLLAT